MCLGRARQRIRRRNRHAEAKMTKSGTTTTIRHQILVDAPIGDAFMVFTERFGDFKPREHNLLKAPVAETVFEPRVGAWLRGFGGIRYTDRSRPRVCAPVGVPAIPR
jgi:hypothetical protein